jgi:hypothetical protein
MSATEESVPIPSITERIQVRAREVKEAATRALQSGLRSVGMGSPDRGPADYDAFADERRFYQRLLREGTGSRNNGDGGSNTWQKWLVTLCGGLALMGVGGGIVMYGKLSAIEANQVSQQRQLDQLASTVATLRRAP